MPVEAPPSTINSTLSQLLTLRAEVEAETEAQLGSLDLADVDPDVVYSIRNLFDYLALRRRDLRSIQRELVQVGVSSLGRSEARVRPQLDAVIAALHGLLGEASGVVMPGADEMWRGESLLARRAGAMFDDEQVVRRGHIIVTLPVEAAEDPTVLESLVTAGADGVRINTAHGDADTWSAMVRNARAAARRAKRRIFIEVDLPGPKVRTAGEAPGGRFKRGDKIWLVPAGAADAAKGLSPRIEVTLGAVLDRLTLGSEVWFDDGKLGGTVTDVATVAGHGQAVLVRIEQAAERGRKIRVGKGFNFPDTEIDLPVPTPQDLSILPDVVPFADGIALSFVQRPHEIDAVHDAIAALAPPAKPTVILKIETRLAVRNLPAMLTRALLRGSTAVMIARGDLAVELGFERLAEIQEELLWLCEAAHVPVIWATQVLEGLAKNGTPSRAEVTDAAMAARADAVLLNKGPYAAAAVRSLADVLQRMDRHHNKKSARLGILRTW